MSPEPADEGDGVAAALGHLQAAALSMVAAARAALDAAERLAKDPGPLLDLLAEGATAARSRADPGSTAPTAPPPPPPSSVEHIPVAQPAPEPDGAEAG